jgi:hypothetical protein
LALFLLFCLTINAQSRFYEVIMEHKLTQSVAVKPKTNTNGSLLLGTGLAVASMILIPAFAMRMGLSASLTGALRMAAMKAGHQAMRGH